MKLMEFQGKALFAQSGLRVPNGKLITSADEAASLKTPAVLKCQVLTGGRGRAGGVRVVSDPSKLVEEAESLLNLEIKGERTVAVLAEEPAAIERELYISITYKGAQGAPVIIASGEGGMAIEDVAAADPGKIAVVPIDPFVGITAYQAKYLARRMSLDDEKGLFKALKALYDCFVTNDCSLVEINPLALTAQGLCALDSKVVLDDKALFRHKELAERLALEQGDCAEAVREDTITFVGLEGDIGLIADGAGTGMLTLDLVNERGGSVSSFCELGGVTNADVMYTALKETMEYHKPKALLMIFIGGFNRMDDMASGITRYKEDFSLDLPVVVRMCGTREAEGKQMLEDAGIHSLDKLDDAVEKAVAASKGR